MVIFTRWQPWRALLGALLFGCIESLIPRIAAAGIRVPQYFMLMTPDLITLAVMIRTKMGKNVRSSKRARHGLCARGTPLKSVSHQPATGFQVQPRPTNTTTVAITPNTRLTSTS